MTPTKKMEYIERIDASFPHDDEKAWKATIDEGIRLSDNAAYMALLAICSSSCETSRDESDRMIQYWSSHYDHPTKPVVLKAARARIGRSEMPEDECLRYLSEIAAYPGLYNAVGIVWQAAPRDKAWVGKATEAVELLRGRPWARQVCLIVCVMRVFVLLATPFSLANEWLFMLRVFTLGGIPLPFVSLYVLRGNSKATSFFSTEDQAPQAEAGSNG
jgi:hypothetical protein